MVDIVNEVDENNYLRNSVTHIYAFENTEVILRKRLKYDRSSFIPQLQAYFKQVLDKSFDYTDMVDETSFINYVQDRIDEPVDDFLKTESDERIGDVISESVQDYLDNEVEEFIGYMIDNHSTTVPHVCLIDEQFNDKLFKTIKDKQIYDDLVQASVYISIPLSDNISVNIVDKDFLYFISDAADTTIAKPSEHPISKRLPYYLIQYTYKNKLDSLIKEYEDDERSIREGIKYINNL